MSTHAVLSPSSAHRWIHCPGSVALSVGEEDKSSEYADEGTKAHELAADWLTGVNRLAIDPEMGNHVQFYVDMVRDYADGNALHVEHPLSIAEITGEMGAIGTADAVIVADDEITVIDLKYGITEVAAEENPQLMIYALAAVLENELLYDFKRVRLVIVQPRSLINVKVKEWSCSIDYLKAFGEAVHRQAGKAFDICAKLILPEYAPGESQCRYCRAKTKCPALDAHISETIGAEFTDLTTDDKSAQVEIIDSLLDNPATLGAKLDAVELIEQWCKAVRAKAEAAMLAGEEVAGYKLVMGKRGNRAWTDAAEAEALLKQMRLKVDEMYDLKLVSPTSVEKVMASSPRRWAKVLPLITRAEGKPSVAKLSDKRPAIERAPLADAFDDLSGDDLV